MRKKAIKTVIATVGLTLGLAIAPASFASGSSAASPPQSRQKIPYSSRSKTNQASDQPNTNKASDTYTPDPYSSWWNDQTTSSSNCAKSFSQLDQCSV